MIDYSNYTIDGAAEDIKQWADNTFPGRSPVASLSKLVLEEIPELLMHFKEHGTRGIAGEFADTLILLLDLGKIWKIDIGKALGEKMFINERRMWKKDMSTGTYQHVNLVQRIEASPHPMGPVDSEGGEA